MFTVWMNQEVREFTWDWKDQIPDLLRKLLERPESRLLLLVRSLLFSLLLLFVGRKIIKLTIKLFDRAFKKANMDEGVAKFLISLSRILLHGVLIVMIMNILGLETSSLVAVVASAGLTIGLALQGSLSNFAGGVLILILKPFHVGDVIIALGNEGTVTGIDIFYTRLLTGDNKVVVIPNGTLSNSSIINVTNERIRRLELTITVAYSQDIQKVKDILMDIAKKNELVLKDQDIHAYIEDFNASAVTIGIRLWVDCDDFWHLKCNLLEEIKEVFDQKGIAVSDN